MSDTDLVIDLAHQTCLRSYPDPLTRGHRYCDYAHLVLKVEKKFQESL